MAINVANASAAIRAFMIRLQHIVVIGDGTAARRYANLKQA